MKFWPTVFKIALMLGVVTVIVDVIDGDAAILRGFGAFLGSIFSGVGPDVTW